MARRYQVRVIFTTLTLGANPDYTAEPFYRGNMAEDANRVDRLFRECHDKGCGGVAWG